MTEHAQLRDTTDEGLSTLNQSTPSKYMHRPVTPIDDNPIMLLRNLRKNKDHTIKVLDYNDQAAEVFNRQPPFMDHSQQQQQTAYFQTSFDGEGSTQLRTSTVQQNWLNTSQGNQIMQTSNDNSLNHGQFDLMQYSTHGGGFVLGGNDMQELLQYHQQEFLSNQHQQNAGMMSSFGPERLRTQSSAGYDSKDQRKAQEAYRQQEARSLDKSTKRYRGVQKFMLNQASRLEKVKAQMVDGEKQKQVQQFGSWSSAKVDEEIVLLKRARQMTQLSQQMRLRHGGSLVKPFKAHYQPDCKPRQEVNPFQGGHSVESALPEGNSVMNSYFRHLPQLIQQNQSMRAAALRPPQDAPDATPGSQTARPKKLLQSQRAMSALQYSGHLTKRTKALSSLMQIPLNEQVTLNFKREEIKNIIWQLPIIMAEKPQMNNSDDFFFFQGCQMLHKQQYEDAVRLFQDVVSNCQKPRSRSMFNFNLAYALFKLNEKDGRVQEIWKHQIGDEEPFIKMLAQYNLSVLTYYLELSDAPPSVDQIESLQVALQYFESFMQHLVPTIMLMMQGLQTSNAPFWLNLDSFTASSKRLYDQLKRFSDRIPEEKVKAEGRAEGTTWIQALQPDDSSLIDRRMSQRVQFTARFNSYQAFFRRYQVYKSHLSTSTAIKIKQDLVQARSSNNNTVLATKRTTQCMKCDSSEAVPPENFQAAYQDFLDQATPDKHFRSFFNMTPLLRANQDFDRVMTQVPTQSQLKVSNFQNQLSLKSLNADFVIPFVESKRPEVLIRNIKAHKRQESLRPQSISQMHKVEVSQRAQTQLNIPQVNLIEQDKLTPASTIQMASSLFPTPADDRGQFHDLISNNNIKSQEFPIVNSTSNLPASSQASIIPGILKTPQSRQTKVGTEQVMQAKTGVQVSLAGDVTFNTRKLLQKKQTEPTSVTQNVSGSGITPKKQTGADVTAGTSTWIRHSLIQSTNPHTSIRAEPKTPLSRQADLMILEKIPQSSEFAHKPEKFEPISVELDKPFTKNGFLAPPSQPQKGKKTPSSSNISNQLMGVRRRSQENDHHETVLEEFKGPLINKDGELYDDKAHDQTYKKRLRMREVHRIQEYLAQGNDGTYNHLEDTISSDAPSVGGKKFIKYSEIDEYLRRLPFFSKYSYNLRQEILLASAPQDLVMYRAGETIFIQGDDCPKVFVIIRGSVKAILIKEEYGFIPIIVSTFYDGKEFGESTIYQVSNEITPEMMTELNKQKYTCEAMEETFVLKIDKELTLKQINKGLQDTFTQRISFLSQIEIFQGIDVHLLLPLANNLEVRRYRLGEYLLKEGQPPTGLFMVTRGQLRVGSEQLNLRSKDLFPEGRQKNRVRQFRLKGCFHDMEGKVRIFDDDGKGGGRSAAEEEDRDGEAENDGNPAIEVKRIFQDGRMFQNERIRYDEQGRKIKDSLVYKDFMTFFMLNANDFFGGGVLLLKNHQEGEQTQETPQKEHRSQKLDDYGTLSVIADSSEVEVLVMDRDQMSYFPEHIQKEIYARIELAFMHECPYPAKVIERIKDKFQEWERYKLETVGGILRQAFFERKKDKLLVMDR